MSAEVDYLVTTTYEDGTVPPHVLAPQDAHEPAEPVSEYEEEWLPVCAPGWCSFSEEQEGYEEKARTYLVCEEHGTVLR